MNKTATFCRKPACLLVLGILSASAGAADIRDQLEVHTAKAELVITDLAIQDVAAKVKDGISQWAIPANANFRSLPSTIPARPDEPQPIQRYVNGNPVIEYQCASAFAEITKRPAPIRNPFMFSADLTQACVYPFQKGVKVYLIFTNVKKTEALTSGLFNGITKAIRGGDDDYANKQLSENIAAIKKNLPTLLIEKIEIPGQPLQEPDKAAVALLIPEKAAAQPVAAQPPAAAAMPAVASVAAAPAGSLQNKIEARKNLTAMGLTYHAQEQFVAAIRRKDEVAVQLFLEAGGIDLNAKEKGRTPLEIATESNAPEIVKLLGDRLNPPAAPVTGLPGGTPAATAPSLPVAKAAVAGNPAAALSPEQMAQINAEIDKMDMPAAQKEEFRARYISSVANISAQVKAFADRIDPVSGQLR